MFNELMTNFSIANFDVPFGGTYYVMNDIQILKVALLGAAVAVGAMLILKLVCAIFK